MLLSILLYCCVAKRYRYLLRDEVVNELIYKLKSMQS